jgi:hypothetical protein
MGHSMFANGGRAPGGALARFAKPCGRVGAPAMVNPVEAQRPRSARIGSTANGK